MFLKSILSKFNAVLILSTHKNQLIKGAFNFSSTKNPLLELSKSNSLNKIYFSTSIVKRGNLIEFFDDKKNWTEEKVKHGRPWTIDELRLKSNLDLHKLWFVLHKERNMLLTMEEIYTRKGIPMPSHERVAKVDESMGNLLAVVEERNIAYNLLETGETKKVVPYRRYNSFGHIQYYKQREYLVPWYLNRMWKLKYHYKKIPVIYFYDIQINSI